MMISHKNLIHKVRFVLIVILLSLISVFLVGCVDDKTYTWVTCSSCGGSGKGHLNERTGTWTKCITCRGSGRTVKSSSNSSSSNSNGFQGFITTSLIVIGGSTAFIIFVASTINRKRLKKIEKKWSKVVAKITNKGSELIKQMPNNKVKVNYGALVSFHNEYIYYCSSINNEKYYYNFISSMMKNKSPDETITNELIKIYESLRIIKIPINSIKQWSYGKSNYGLDELKLSIDFENFNNLKDCSALLNSFPNMALKMFEQNLPKKRDTYIKQKANEQKMNAFTNKK